MTLTNTLVALRWSATAHRLLPLIPLLFFAAVPNWLLADDIYTFSVIPSPGNISGAPGATIGWGYSITNQSTADWLLATNLNADSFAWGMPNLLFDFPEVAPGATVMEAFDPIGGTGLYEDMLNGSAPLNSMDSGHFVLSAQWYEGDPFNGGNLIADAIDSSAAYTATVTGGVSSAPEPHSVYLLLTAVVAAGALRAVQRRRAMIRRCQHRKTELARLSRGPPFIDRTGLQRLFL